MWWWKWRKVRRATLPPALRDEFELLGEDVLAHTASIVATELSGEKRQRVFEWLRERRDIAERHENRLETVEKWILIFVFLGVVVEVVNLVRAFAH